MTTLSNDGKLIHIMYMYMYMGHYFLLFFVAAVSIALNTCNA